MPEPSGDVRRTSLANERTQLAWWRTGLTALAVALAVGKGHTQWPYSVVGVAFALYGIALIAYGNARSRAVDRAASRGEYAPMPFNTLNSLGAVGMGLGLLVVLLVIFD
jgi:putative membrane protein